MLKLSRVSGKNPVFLFQYYSNNNNIRSIKQNTSCSSPLQSLLSRFLPLSAVLGVKLDAWSPRCIKTWSSALTFDDLERLKNCGAARQGSYRALCVGWRSEQGVRQHLAFNFSQTPESSCTDRLTGTSSFRLHRVTLITQRLIKSLWDTQINADMHT